MLAAKAYARYIRVSPRKMRQVIDLIRGEKVNRALVILTNLNKAAKVYVDKALKSAISNARRNHTLTPDKLFISKITADNGPSLKRYRAAAMGRATTIRHRSTHLTIELTSFKEQQVKPKKKTAQATRRYAQRPKLSRKKQQKRKEKK